MLYIFRSMIAFYRSSWPIKAPDATFDYDSRLESFWEQNCKVSLALNLRRDVHKGVFIPLETSELSMDMTDSCGLGGNSGRLESTIA